MADLHDISYALDGIDSSTFQDVSHRRRRRIPHYAEKIGSVASRAIVVDIRHLDWQNEASCRGTDPESFFPEGPVPHQILRICGHCPVYQQCLDHALDNPTLRGIWGGTTDVERRVMRKKSQRERARRRGQDPHHEDRE